MAGWRWFDWSGIATERTRRTRVAGMGLQFWWVKGLAVHGATVAVDVGELGTEAITEVCCSAMAEIESLVLLD